MNTMTLIETQPRAIDLLAMADAELESWFTDVGLTVEAVPHCSSAACQVCFPTSLTAAKAA